MAEHSGRKPPNKVRTGGEVEGDGGGVRWMTERAQVVYYSARVVGGACRA